VIGQKGGGKFVPALFDLPATGRPALVQRRVDTVDLADGTLAASGGALDELDAEGFGEAGSSVALYSSEAATFAL
jgi:hypothetical protein